MSEKQTVTIGTRGSDLALWQAYFVKEQLENLGCQVNIDIIKTRGDEIQHLSFEKMEGKGFFTKEIEEALLSNQIDLAIHSFKDLETTKVPGLEITAVSYRENPTDSLIIKRNAVDKSRRFSLKDGAKVGTSSARRKAQLRGFIEGVELVDLRGNVPTRIDKLQEGKYDAIMLATAGLNRLKIDLSEFHVEQLNPKEFIPAPAQGVLGLQTRSDDSTTNSIVEQLNDQSVRELIEIERGVLKMFSGGCQLPLGVYCEKENDEYYIWGALGLVNGLVNRAHFITKDTANASKTMFEALKKKALK
jgi:hydroxymethylbilane synthase